MEFDRLLEEVTTLVRERGRVSLGAVAQYFDLDDARLRAVEDELVHARGTLELENGRVLVAGPAAVAPDAMPAERRHLTVMFVDMVGSTDLAARLDPEELRDLVREYQLTASASIERFEGHIAQYLGDGLLVYFGYPTANEDDPRRAVLAAQDILSNIERLNERLAARLGVRVALRVGIHTGLVVVGAVGGGARHEALALGETPNVAARLEALARPGSIVVSEHTRDHLGDLFELIELGPHALKGIPGERSLYEVAGVSGVASRFDLAVKHKLLPMAGRRDELATLVAAWERSRRGAGEAIAVTGDAGIGKSRLIQALKDHLTGLDQRWTALRASPYERNTPLYPVADLLRQTMDVDPKAAPEENLARIDVALSEFHIDHERARDLVAALLGIGRETGEPDGRFALRDTARLVEGLFLQLLQLGPRLLVIEDLHWLDPTSLDLVRRLCAGVSRRALLVVLSARPPFDLATLEHPGLTELHLSALPRADVEQMIGSIAGGRTLDGAVRREIVGRTDGVPAFVEELTRMLLESDWLRERDGHLTPVGPAPPAIPDTLKDTLMARLDRLGDAKAVAQQAAVIGRTFAAELLAEISDLGGERVRDALDALVDAQILRRRIVRGNATYRFRHALLQEAAYQSLLKSVRQTLHERIADALESQFDSASPPPPERVARHLTAARHYERAIGYWQWAGEQAVEKAANSEALSHLQHGLDLLEELEPSPLRDQRELSLVSTMGSALVLSGGWAAPGLREIYARAMAILGRAGNADQVDFQVLGGLCAYHLVLCEFDVVDVLAQRLLRQSARNKDQPARVVAHVCLASSTFSRGRFDEAREHAAQVRRHYDPDEEVPVSFLYGQDPAVIADTMAAFMAFLDGDVTEAFALSERAQADAARVKNPFSSLWARAWHARLLFECGRDEAAHTLARATGIACARNEFGYVGALADLVAGAAQVRMSGGRQGIGAARAGLGAHIEQGNVLAATYFRTVAAAAEHAAGHPERARERIEEARTNAGARDDFWRSELLRVDAHLCGDDDPERARSVAAEALAMAQQLDAPMLVLRAAVTCLDLAPGPAQTAAAREALGAALARIDAPDDPRVAAARERLVSRPAGGAADA